LCYPWNKFHRKM